jgi:V/A-type H+-transporting ATPase subunit K
MKVLSWIGAVLVVAVAAGPLLGEAEIADMGGEAGPANLTEWGVYRTMALAASVAFVTAVSILGAAFAVGKIGSAALGAAAEKPELLTRSLLFVALAEGLAVLGFVVAMMLLGQIQ